MYVIVDPLNDKTKGISTYSILLADALNQMGVLHILALKHQSETIDSFANRVSELYDIPGNIVEIPESYAPYFQIKRAKLHVRLHGMDIVLKWKQGQKVLAERFYKEKTTIERADYISSPTLENWNETQKFINLPPKKCVYPNPIPAPTIKSKIEKSIDVLFVGRFVKLKGIEFLREIQNQCNSKIVIYSSKIDLYNRLTFKWIDAKKYEKDKILSMSKVVIIPSLYESFSMVKFEALACGCNVVTWDTCPYVLNDEIDYGVTRAKYPQVDDFCKCILEALTIHKIKEYSDMYNKINNKLRNGLSLIVKQNE